MMKTKLENKDFSLLDLGGFKRGLYNIEESY